MQKIELSEIPSSIIEKIKGPNGNKAINIIVLSVLLGVSSCTFNKSTTNPMEKCIKAIQHKEFGEIPPANHIPTGGQPCACCHMK